jgi:predicted MPP superfamily phosphohydrolase
MGLRFSIQNANSIGHFVNGNILSFLDDFIKIKDRREGTIEFLDSIINHPERDFYTTLRNWRLIRRDYDFLRGRWAEIKEQLYRLGNQEPGEAVRNFDIPLLEYLRVISDLLSKCKIKTLLLPGFADTQLNSSLLDTDFLRHLVRIHPGDSALILQLKEKLSEEGTAILNVFSKFDTAYDKVDQWPGVLFWNDTDSVFVPVETEGDVVSMFEFLHFENGSLRFLKDLANQRRQAKRYGYFFHLSDLHFGHEQCNRRKLRLGNILKRHLNELETQELVLPIITGDLVDTPKNIHVNSYNEFKEMLTGYGFNQPVQILGNHDVDTGGFLKRASKQKTVVASLSQPNSIEILEEYQVGFVKFNSNIGGNWAQGEIGQEQLVTVGNEMDSIPNSSNYTYIALVHHHPKIIENPDWYKRDWIERVLGKAGFEKTMRMIDADEFLNWNKARKIDLILHGHKHIPTVHEHDGITIVAAGSATGKVAHVDKGKTYLSYNVIKFDLDTRRPVSCTILAEEILGGGTKDVLLHNF